MVLLRARLDDLARWSVQSPIMCEIKDRPGHWLVICK
jgi:hypothetical protein